MNTTAKEYLNTRELAELLGVSESALERDWRAAKAWLAARMRPRSAHGHVE